VETFSQPLSDLHPANDKLFGPKRCLLLRVGGRGGIRTHGTLAGTPVFKTGALNHSATLPLQQHQSPGGPKIKNGLANTNGSQSRRSGPLRTVQEEVAQTDETGIALNEAPSPFVFRFRRAHDRLHG
jgi:hypothetical protein